MISIKHRFKAALITGLLCLLLSSTGHAQAGVLPSTDKLAQLMDDALQAMKEAQYDRAIQNYNEIISLPKNAYERDALELLGLAYERKGDFKRAKTTYERYLQLYGNDKNDASERVKQRLAGIATATWEDAPQKLKEVKKSNNEQWRVYGSLAQYLRRDVSQYDNQPAVVNQSALTTYFDVTARKRGETLDIKTRISASDYRDLEGNQDDQQRLSYAYLDITERQDRYSFSVGRQNASGGGILGRYDGIELGYRLSSKYKLNLVTGRHVERTSEFNPDNPRYFYGLNLETGPWDKYWEANVYYIEQNAEDILDRQAVGGELRYLHPDINIYTLLDYDISYDSVNIFSTQGSYTNSARDTVTFIFDYRNAPPITTSNALIGQPEDNLADLAKRYTVDELSALAKDRTPRSTLFMLGYSHQVDNNYRWDIDGSVTTISDTPASGGVEAIQSSDNYYLSTRLTASNWLTPGDNHILGLAHNSNDTASTLTLSINSRMPTGNGWYVNPRFIYARSDYDNGDGLQRITPGLRIEYQLTRDALLEFDTIYEWSTQQLWYGDVDSTYYYIDIGYRLNF